MEKHSHKLRNLFSFISLIALSMLVLSCADDNKEDLTGLITSFKVKVNNEVLEGNIDEDACQISFQGIKNLNAITDVEYQLKEEASIYPDPKIRLAQWQTEERFIVTVGGAKQVYTVIMHILSEPDPDPEPETDATIYPEQYYGKVIKDFFLDLKGNLGGVGSDKAANDFFVLDGMNGVRIPVLGSSDRPTHPSAGVVDDSEGYYAKLINSINRAKKARGNNEFIIFASKKLNAKESFPDWVKDSNGVIPEQYAIMLADFLSYMKEKNIIIDVLGIDNEENFNEGKITPKKHIQIVDKLKALAIEKGFKMPLIAGPDRYQPMGDVDNCWMKQFVVENRGDCLDIYGMHYYPKHREIFDALKFELSLIGDRPFWATEPHWDAKDGENDMLDYAETAICTLWDQTDLGMDGFMWWSYKRTGDLRGNLMRIISVPIKDARPIVMDDHDGRDTKEKYKLQTRAFRKGNTISVYVINMCNKDDIATAKAYQDYVFGLKTGMIDGEVEYMQWTDDTPVEGVQGNAQKIDDSNFSLTLPVRSITYFQFNLQ